MTNETRALVPGPTSLPAAIERRTQIVNRLLGELTRRDTEGFFRRHLEFFRLVASRHYPLDEALLDRYADRWDWEGDEGLSWNEALPWSAALIDRYADRWDWGWLSENAALPWSAALIECYADRWEWERLSENAAFPWSEALMTATSTAGIGGS
jgi:hypothetical protein